MGHQNVGHDAKQRDRLHVLGKVKGGAGLRRVQRLRHRRHEQRVAVLVCAADGIGRKHGTVARSIFDHNRLTQHRLHVLADKTRQRISGRSSSKSNEDPDRSGGIVLRSGRARCKCTGNQRGDRHLAHF